MDKKLLLKLVAIGFMSLLLLVPLALIEDQIRQRSSRQEEVQRNIANSAAGPQTLTGPVLAVYYREQIEPEIKKDPATGRTRSTPRFVERSLYLPAETLKLSGEARVETRQRGIYQARLYHLDLAVAGRFVLPVHLGLDAQRSIVSAEATLLLGVSVLGDEVPYELRLGLGREGLTLKMAGDDVADPCGDGAPVVPREYKATHGGAESGLVLVVERCPLSGEGVEL